LGKSLKGAGFHTARNGEKVDVCVINTCSVTEVADKKGRQAIHRIIRQHPEAFVVVTGCMAQLQPDEVAHIEGVDVILGADKKNDILEYLNDLQKSKATML
jgi:threonylcarbamoyladenosine tRNA methylthiotransferase MtaB